jgi:hypothetical protein
VESFSPGFHIVDKLNDVVVYWPKRSEIVDIIRVTKGGGKSNFVSARTIKRHHHHVLHLVVSSIRPKSEKTSCCAPARKCALLS